MIILSIDTSCDETAVAITNGRRVLAHVEYTQIATHQPWGGVVPSLARRAHEERIDGVIEAVCKKFVQINKAKIGTKSEENFTQRAFKDIDYIAVTYGPGLAIALEVGITKAKELAQIYEKELIGINHMEGHLYSCFAQNREGNPGTEFKFPYLVLLVSGAHTELVRVDDHLHYTLLGETRDDAAGEALDKAARMLGFQYPGGPVIERLAALSLKEDIYKFPRPMRNSKDLDFSFSGLKTSLYNLLNKIGEEEKIKNLNSLSYSFQEAVVESILIKVEQAVKNTGINRLIVGGGVVANTYLRLRLRRLLKKHAGEVLFPPYKYLTADNAAMIGVAAHYRVLNGNIIRNEAELDRQPRLSLA